MYKNTIKRLLDIFLSSILIILLLPFMFIIALLVKMDSWGPVFFAQERVGKNLSTMVILKFRTMTDEKREVDCKPIIGRAPGVTGIGYYLRRFKIDELPQLYNVLNGDMSLIGPRPSIHEQLKYMTENEKSRYDVRPGITGLAQVSGNIHISWKERYKYDLLYVNTISFNNDLRIIARTISIVFLGEEKYKNNPLQIKRRK